MSIEIKRNMGASYYKDGATPDNLSGYVSKSILWDCFKARSPYKWRYGKPKEPTPAMAFGSLVHTLALTPQRLHEEYALSEWESFRTKAAQEWRAEQETNGKTVVTQEQMFAANEIALTIQDELDPAFSEGPEYEVAIYADTPHKVKCMIDVVPASAPGLIDIKTISSIQDEQTLVRTILSRGYHWQAAMYLDLWNAATDQNRTDFHLLFIETEAPYETAWVKLSKKMLDTGRGEYQHALMQWYQCVKSGVWPKTINGVLTAELPAWYGI